MDDSLELPHTLLEKSIQLNSEDDDQASDDEDGGLDWTQLMPPASRPVIPKRGEKEFEPRANGGTNLQMHILDRSRMAMFETLRTTRTIANKGISYGIWYPSLSRTHVTIARGIHFTNMGHSAPRQTLDENGVTKVQKRMELLPEEAIYLIERGSLFCWKESDVDTSSIQGFDGFAGVPMSVQQAYAEMVGKEGLTLEKFQVYAYLRRLGYAVTRTEAPSDAYPTAPPFDLSKPQPQLSLFQRILSLFSKAFRVFKPAFNWWKPVRISKWTHHNYASIYRSLRFLSTGHNVPLQRSSNLVQPQSSSSSSSSPYKIFYNIYKPSTPFKKSTPGLPDFQVVIVNARTSPMPTLHELSALFDIVPELPLPVPRPRRQAYGQKDVTGTDTNTNTNISTIITSSSSPPQPTEQTQPQTQEQQPDQQLKPSPSPTSLLTRLFPSLFSPKQQETETETETQRKINPFAALKQGKKIIVIAAVDNGNISFFRFSQGSFEEWPMA